MQLTRECATKREGVDGGASELDSHYTRGDHCRGIGYIASLLGMAWLSQAIGCTAEEAAAGCQRWLLANPFWASFYSNLMSTFAGAGLGLWTALYLNRRVEAAQRARKKNAELRQRLARDAEARERNRAEQEAEWSCPDLVDS